MSDELTVDGKSYISSKRASQTSGYAQDYIGQLSRKGLIDARRVGGLWYINMDALSVYQKKAEEFKPTPPIRPEAAPNPETLVFFDGKEYISAARASEITGYSQDYVGQLARSGTVSSQQVGNRWYIEKESILSHKTEKDRLLAAVQSESVGLVKPAVQMSSSRNGPQSNYANSGPFLHYFKDEGDLLPVLSAPEPQMADVEIIEKDSSLKSEKTPDPAGQTLPIRRFRQQMPQRTPKAPAQRAFRSKSLQAPHKSYLPLLLGAAATIVIVVSVGYASVLRQNSAYASNIENMTNVNSLSASVSTAFDEIGDVLEPLLTRELVYERSDSQ